MPRCDKDSEDMQQFLRVSLRASLEALQNKGWNIKIYGGPRDNMFAQIGEYLYSVRACNIDGKLVNLNPPGRAAVASALILCYQPVYFGDDYVDNACRNYLIRQIAYHAGLDVLISYQIESVVNNKRAFRSEMFPKVKKEFPDLDIESDACSVPNNILSAFSNFAGNGSQRQLKEKLWTLSDIYRSLDDSIKDKVHNYVKQKYDDYRAAFSL